MPRAVHAQHPAAAQWRRQDRAVLLFILALALIARLWGLGEKSLWLDETMTVQNCLKPHDTALPSRTA